MKNAYGRVENERRKKDDGCFNHQIIKLGL
jgi:hypothetical protein